MTANWSCRQCGMSSGRRYSVQRHIDNLHGGYDTPIPFGDYRTGQKYLPGPKPEFTRKFDWPNEMYYEMCRLICQRTAEQIVPKSGDQIYLDNAKLLGTMANLRAKIDRNRIIVEAFSELLRKLQYPT